jgi:hypothetical protein
MLQLLPIDNDVRGLQMQIIPLLFKRKVVQMIRLLKVSLSRLQLTRKLTIFLRVTLRTTLMQWVSSQDKIEIIKRRVLGNQFQMCRICLWWNLRTYIRLISWNPILMREGWHARRRDTGLPRLIWWHQSSGTWYLKNSIMKEALWNDYLFG